MRRRRLAALVAATSLSPFAAHAQMQVFDPANYGQMVQQVAKSVQQIALLQQQLQAALQNLQGQNTSITPSLQNIVSDLDGLLRTSTGVGYSASQSTSAFQSVYPVNWTNTSAASLPTSLSAWRQNTWSAQSDLVAAQSLVASALQQNASAANAAVNASQAAPGPTATLQSTNQLLFALSGQLAQLQTLAIASSRASSAAAAEQQSVGASAAAVSSQALQLPAATSRLSNASHL